MEQNQLDKLLPDDHIASALNCSLMILRALPRGFLVWAKEVILGITSAGERLKIVPLGEGSRQNAESWHPHVCRALRLVNLLRDQGATREELENALQSSVVRMKSMDNSLDCQSTASEMINLAVCHGLIFKVTIDRPQPRHGFDRRSAEAWTLYRLTIEGLRLADELGAPPSVTEAGTGAVAEPGKEQSRPAGGEKPDTAGEAGGRGNEDARNWLPYAKAVEMAKLVMTDAGDTDTIMHRLSAAATRKPPAFNSKGKGRDRLFEPKSFKSYLRRYWNAHHSSEEECPIERS